MAMVSALLSMLPFKFNRMLEEQIDHSLEEGKKHITEIGTKMSADIHHEINKLEKGHVRHKGRKAEKGENNEQAASDDPNAAYMPKQPDANTADEGNPYRDYMPK